MSKKGIVRVYQNEVAELRDRVAELERKLNEACAVGWDGAVTFYTDYCAPVQHDLDQLNAILHTIHGLILGNRSIPQLKDQLTYLTADLETWLGQVDRDIARYRVRLHELGLPDESRIDIEPALSMRSALVAFYSGADKDGGRLVELIENFSPAGATLTQLRGKHGGGRPDGLTPECRKLAKLAIQFRNQTSGQWHRVGLAMIHHIEQLDTSRNDPKMLGKLLDFCVCGNDGRVKRVADKAGFGRYLSNLVSDYKKSLPEN